MNKQLSFQWPIDEETLKNMSTEINKQIQKKFTSLISDEYQQQYLKELEEKMKAKFKQMKK